MSDQTPVENLVMPLDVSIADPIRALLASRCRRGTGAAFIDPDTTLTIPGSRATGQYFRSADLPANVVEHLFSSKAEDAPAPFVPPTPVEVRIPKRAAKSVAEEVSGFPARCLEQRGRCYIQVFARESRLEFQGLTWYAALASVIAHFRPKS